MKKTLLTTVLILLGTLAFSQERIAVFPFEDIDNLQKNNEHDLFYRQFSIESKTSSEKQSYKIGDTGPAGGIIFYKSLFSTGWRYLEAAPPEAEFYIFLFRDVDICSLFAHNTMTFIGSGKQNTRNLIYQNKMVANDVLNLNSHLDINGYKDWFIPSKDELDFIYFNLKQKGLCKFKEYNYLSSSFADDNKLWIQNFINGHQSLSPFNSVYIVLAVRAF